MLCVFFKIYISKRTFYLTSGDLVLKTYEQNSRSNLSPTKSIRWPSAESRPWKSEHPYNLFCSRMIRRAEVPFAGFVIGLRIVHTAMVHQLYLPSVPSSSRTNCVRDSDAARVQVICHHHPRGDGGGIVRPLFSSSSPSPPMGFRLITPVRDARMVRCHSLRTTTRAASRTARLIIGGSTILECWMKRNR